MIKLVDLLKVLADEKRFKIVNLLLEQTLCVRALAGKLEISEAAVSQHLKILREAGLVKGEKRGYWTHYSVEEDVLTRIGDDLKNLVQQKTGCSPLCQPDSLKKCLRKE